MIFLNTLMARRLVSVLAIAVGASVASFAVAQSTAKDAAAPASEGDQIKKLMEQKFQGVVIGSVAKSPYFGLYEVQFDDQLVYTDAKVSYVMVGSVYDPNTKKNLTELKLRQLNRVPFETLPLDLAFKRVKGNGERKLAIFSDADCPFCLKLEHELKNIDNVTIYTFLFPIDQLHPDAARKSRVIWCAPDKAKAWDDFFATGSLPTGVNGDCDNPIAATAALGKKLKVVATPTMIFADGSMLPGALPYDRLEAEIKQGEAEAARLASAKK
jgi:thiol:disulfide interchange protein DsbC